MTSSGMAARLVALVGMLACLTACGIQGLQNMHSADVIVSENTNGQRLTMPGEMPTFDLWKDCLPTQRRNGACTASFMEQFDTTSNKEDRIYLRNSFQDYLLWRSEQQCERHKAHIIATQSGVNFGLNTVTTAVAGTAAIVTAPATNILAAIAAIASGIRGHFNEDFYRQYVGPAVVKKINSNREEFYAWIMARRGTPVGALSVTVATAKKTDAGGTQVDGTLNVANASKRDVSVDEYTVLGAKYDAEKYHELCSFISGLSSLVDPGPTFGDTAVGIQQRIDMLRQQLAANNTLALTLGAENQAAHELRRVNADIARQIMVLQQRLLTAPIISGAAKTAG